MKTAIVPATLLFGALLLPACDDGPQPLRQESLESASVDEALQVFSAWCRVAKLSRLTRQAFDEGRDGENTGMLQSCDVQTREPRSWYDDFVNVITGPGCPIDYGHISLTRELDRFAASSKLLLSDQFTARSPEALRRFLVSELRSQEAFEFVPGLNTANYKLEAEGVLSASAGKFRISLMGEVPAAGAKTAAGGTSGSIVIEDRHADFRLEWEVKGGQYFASAWINGRELNEDEYEIVSCAH